MSAPSSRMPWWRRWFGTRSERAAARHLRRAGMRVLARNVNLPQGEIDIVALDGRTVVFVEVRSTERADTSRPAESVDDRKQARLSEAPFDLVFADPPYAFTGYAALLAAAAPLLAADGEVVVEHSSRLELPLEAGPLVRTDVRRYGESSLSFYRRRPG